MDKVNVLIIDKTGTITEGKPTVEKLYSSQNEDDKLLQIIGSLNKYSEHPLAKAIVNIAIDKKIAFVDIPNFKSLAGMGVTGTINNTKTALGNKKLMEYIAATIPKEIDDKVINEQNLGKTVSYISIDSLAIGYVSIVDAIKPTSKVAIENLRQQGIEIVMLTGDNPNTAKAVANTLKLSSYKAGMLPLDKLNEIKKLQKEGKIVAMAGDGINDAPALAQANVGIAMSTGTDVAIESAKITLVKGDLQGLVKVKKLSHAIMLNIKQNLFFALLYNAIGIPIAAGLLYPI
jgi:P-type Cu+ transporter